MLLFEKEWLALEHVNLSGTIIDNKIVTKRRAIIDTID